MEWSKPSYSSEHARKFNHDLAFDNILSDEQLKPSTVLRKLANFESGIEQSLMSGNFELLKVNKVKTADGYSDAMGFGAYKAAYVWNKLNPDHKIELPGREYILKVNMKKQKDIAELSVKNPVMFERLTALFQEDRIKKSGITSIGLPVDIDTIPEWLRPYIAIEELITANTNLSLPMLKSLGISTVYKTQSNMFFSNIIDI